MILVRVVMLGLDMTAIEMRRLARNEWVVHSLLVLTVALTGVAYMLLVFKFYDQPAKTSERLRLGQNLLYGCSWIPMLSAVLLAVLAWLRRSWGLMAVAVVQLALSPVLFVNWLPTLIALVVLRLQERGLTRES